MESQTFLLCALELLVKSAGILLSVICAFLLLGRASASTRAGIALAGMLAVLLLPTTKLAKPLWSYSWSRPERVAVIERGVVANKADPESAVPANQLPSSNSHASLLAEITFPAAYLGLWFAGCFSILARRIGASVQLRALVSKSHPVIDESAKAVVARLGSRAGKFPEVRVSSQTEVPLALGILRPLILLPQSALRWSEDRLQAALLHEAGHIGRRDALARWIADLACALYWMNPLVWVARRVLVLEQEKACDDFVLSQGANPANYASQLVEIVRELRPPQAQSALAMAHSSTLESRVRAIVDDTRNRRSLRGIHAFLGIGLVACSLGACSAFQFSASKRIQPKQPAFPISDPQKAVWEVGAYIVEIGNGAKLPKIAWLTRQLEAATPGMEVLDQAKFQETMRALNQAKGVSILSTPRVTAKSRQQVGIESVREFICPASSPSSWKKTDSSQSWQPEKFDHFWPGVTLKCKGEVENDGSFEFTELTTKIVTFQGLAHSEILGEPSAPPAKPALNLSDFLNGRHSDRLGEFRPWTVPIFSTITTKTSFGPVYSGQVVCLPMTKPKEDHSRFVLFVTLKIHPAQ